MIAIILKPQQYNQWNAFVEQSPQGDVFCYSWWLEAVTKSNFKILAIFENEEIVAGMPLAFDGQNKVNEPPLTRTLGVLYKDRKYSSMRKQTSVERKWLSELLKYLPKSDFVQMCMHHNFNDWLLFRWNGFKQTTRYTYIIKYENNTIDDLWCGLDQLRKRMIKKAYKNGINVEMTDDFDLLYQFVNLTYERQGINFLIPYNAMKSLDIVNKEMGHRLIFKAIDNNSKVHAMIYLAFNHKSAYYLLSGSDPVVRNLGGHTLVMWEAIKYFSDKVRYFNFGGSDIENIEEHVRGFGGTLTPYFHIYNEKFMGKRNDFWYHFDQTLFHLSEIFKIVKNKLLKILHLK